jgi:hypothetical protein
MLGRTVVWTGVVLDVRDGQVLVEMRRSSLKNEAALMVAWWDRWKLDGVNRGDLIEFTGMLGGFGDPYPYAISHGTIRSTRPVSQDEAKLVLPE